MPDPDGPMTQRDASRLESAMRDLTQSMRQLSEKIEATYVRKDVLGPQIESINDRLDTHAGYWTWVVRIVIGAIIVAVIGLLFATGGANGAHT